MTIDLNKRTESAQISLVKLGEQAQADGKNMPDELCARVVVAIDFSGSMKGRYQSGEVQTTVERVLALSLAGLDDDGDIQVHFFDTRAYDMEEVDKNSYVGFVDNWRRGKTMGGTNYSGVIQNIITEAVGGKKKLFGKRSSGAGSSSLPTFVIFVTDGAPGDQGKAMQLLKDASDKPIFWQFLGLGYSPSFLKQLDTMGDRVVDNVGLTEMSQTRDMQDEEWFNEVLEEFVTGWIPAARSAGILA